MLNANDTRSQGLPNEDEKGLGKKDANHLEKSFSSVQAPKAHWGGEGPLFLKNNKYPLSPGAGQRRSSDSETWSVLYLWAQSALY